MFRSIKTVMIDLLDECYSTATRAVVAARPHLVDSMQYREFNNTKPSDFDGI